MKNSDLGERIRTVRGSQSRAAFGKRIGITSGSLRNYEAGAALPNADVLTKICETCGVSTDWLLFGRGPMLVRVEPTGPEAVAVSGQTLPEANADLPVPERTGTCVRCDMWVELKKEMEAFRRANEQVIRMDLANETIRLRNMRLEEEIRALRDRVVSLERENARLLATRDTAGRRKKGSAHVDHMTLVSAPPRLQEISDSFSGDMLSGE